MYFLSQRVHPTWFITIGCIGLLVGIAAARFVGPASFLFCIAGGVLVILSLLRQRAWLLVLIAIGAIMIGLWRGGLELQSRSVFQYAMGKVVTLAGSISADPQLTNGKQAVTLQGVSIKGAQYGGTIYVTLGETPKLRREDKITVTAQLAPSYGTYVASMYDAKLQSVERPNNIFLHVRDMFGEALRKVVAEPMASLGVGILVGQKSELPSDFSDALKIAGLTHVVVASGYNLTILVRLARRLFEKVSKYQAALWSVLMILGFMAITGWSASMTRAGLVAGLSLWAWYFGRQFHPITLLAVAASGTAMFYPPYAWGDIGWALSFAAFAGVIVFAPLVQAYFYGTQKAGFVARTLLETFSAQLVTLPIMLGVFGQFSVVALLSNIMVLSVVPLAMLLAFMAGISQLVVPMIAPIVAWPAQYLLSYIVWAINWTASFPWAQVKWQMPWWGIVASYMGVIAICVYLRRVTGYNLRQVNIVE